MPSFLHPDDHPCQKAEPRGNRLPRFVAFWYCPSRAKQISPALDCSDSCPYYLPKEQPIMPKPFPWDAPASSLIADAPEHLTMLGYALEQLDAKVPAAKVAKALGCGLSTLSNKLAAFRKESAGKTETPRRPASTIAPTPAAAVPPLPAGEGRGEGLPDPAPSPEPVQPGRITLALVATPPVEALDGICAEVIMSFIIDRGLIGEVLTYDQGYRAGMRSRIP